MTLEDLITLHLDGLRARQRSPAFREHQRHYLTAFLTYCTSHKLIYPEQLKFQHIVAYAGILKDKTLRDITRYQMLGTVRRWLKWAVYHGHLPEDPGAEWQPRHPAHGPLRSVPTEQQMQTLLEAPPHDTLQGKRDRVLLELLYGTGLRVKECVHLTVLDVSLQDCTVLVHGKGDRPRHQPLGLRLVEMLRAYLEDVRPHLAGKKTSALFPHDRGGPMREHSIAWRLRLYGQQVGQPHFSVHSIRHAFGTHLLKGGAPLWAVQKLLGHEVLASTAIYTRILPLDVQAEVILTHPRAKARSRGGKPSASQES